MNSNERGYFWGFGDANQGINPLTGEPLPEDQSTYGHKKAAEDQATLDREEYQFGSSSGFGGRPSPRTTVKGKDGKTTTTYGSFRAPEFKLRSPAGVRAKHRLGQWDMAAPRREWHKKGFEATRSASEIATQQILNKTGMTREEIKALSGGSTDEKDQYQRLLGEQRMLMQGFLFHDQRQFTAEDLVKGPQGGYFPSIDEQENRRWREKHVSKPFPKAKDILDADGKPVPMKEIESPEDKAQAAKFRSKVLLHPDGSGRVVGTAAPAGYHKEVEAVQTPEMKKYLAGRKAKKDAELLHAHVRLQALLGKPVKGAAGFGIGEGPLPQVTGSKGVGVVGKVREYDALTDPDERALLLKAANNRSKATAQPATATATATAEPKSETKTKTKKPKREGWTPRRGR